MPVDAPPKDAFGVNGAHEKLKRKFPVADTEENIAGSGSNICGLIVLVLVVYKKTSVINSTCQCCTSEAQAENDKMFLRVLYLLVSRIGHRYQVQGVIHYCCEDHCLCVSIVYLFLTV